MKAHDPSVRDYADTSPEDGQGYRICSFSMEQGEAFMAGGAPPSARLRAREWRDHD